MSLGHASIVANMKANEIDVVAKSWSVNSTDFHINDVIDFILDDVDTNTDLAIGAYIWNERFIQDIIRRVRPNFPGRIILGGPQISYIKSDIESYYPNADVFIRGYAEEALVQ